MDRSPASRQLRIIIGLGAPFAIQAAVTALAAAVSESPAAQPILFLVLHVVVWISLLVCAFLPSVIIAPVVPSPAARVVIGLTTFPAYVVLLGNVSLLIWVGITGDGP